MEEVILFLMQEGFASDIKSAIHIYEAMSDEWLEDIMEKTEFPWNSPEMRRASREWMKERGMPRKKTPEEQEIIARMAERIQNKTGVHAPTNARGIVRTGQPQSAPKVTKPKSTDKTWVDRSYETDQGKTRTRQRRG